MDHISFPFSVKSLSEAGQIEGLAAGYGNVDSHGEMFAPGAFAKSIAAFRGGGRRPAMLLHHDQNRPAGRWDTFEETPKGLRVAGHLAVEATDGREAYALLKAGALTGLSVGFNATKTTTGAGRVPLITEAELFEVSLVSTPSNPLTQIASVKNVGDVRDLEDLLKQAGFSGRKAKAAAAAAWRAIDNNPAVDPQRDAIASILSRSAAAINARK